MGAQKKAGRTFALPAFGPAKAGGYYWLSCSLVAPVRVLPLNMF